jgi:hypothetical protein
MIFHPQLRQKQSAQYKKSPACRGFLWPMHLSRHLGKDHYITGFNHSFSVEKNQQQIEKPPTNTS